MGRRPWRPWEVGSQTLVTALCGLAATLAWLTLGGGVVGNVDFIALATLFTASSGLQKRRERPLLQVPVFACRAASLSISDCTACAAWPANSFCWVAAAA